MKDYIFPYSASFGRLDSVESEIEVSLSNKDANALEKSAKQGGMYNLTDADELEAIFDKVYSLILKRERNILKDDGEMSNREIDEYLDDINFNICFPVELQMLECKVKPNQTKYEVLITDRETADILKKEKSNNVIYVDDGECLYYIPRKYSDSFILKEGTKSFEEGVFKEHKNIKSIILSDGIELIPEWCFEACEKLESITIPGSVKRIEFNAFTKCYKLSNVEIAEGIEYIDHCAFRFCDSLTEIKIPSTVKEINNWITHCFSHNIGHVYICGMDTSVSGNNTLRESIWHVHKDSEAEKNLQSSDIKYELF